MLELTVFHFTAVIESLINSFQTVLTVIGATSLQPYIILYFNSSIKRGGVLENIEFKHPHRKHKVWGNSNRLVN